MRTKDVVEALGPDKREQWHRIDAERHGVGGSDGFDKRLHGKASQFDVSKAYLQRKNISQIPKAQIRAENNALLEAWLKKGNKIKKLPYIEPTKEVLDGCQF